MFESLFNSKVKKDLLNVFFACPERGFYPSELAELLGVGKKRLAEGLRELESAGVLVSYLSRRKKYYRINRYLKWYDELCSLAESYKTPPDDLVSRRLKHFRRAKLILLTGVFTGQPRVETDVIFIGDDLMSRSVNSALKDLSRWAGQEVNYTLMDLEEFERRRMMNDRFIRDVLDNSYIVVLNKGVLGP